MNVALKDFSNREQGVRRLQRSLERNRLAQAYLFAGPELDSLEGVAKSLVKTLNCLQPLRRTGVAVDCCDRCPNCTRIDHGNFPDVYWLRPESKTRVIRIEPVRDLMRDLYLRPTEAERKVAVIVGADRMNTQAANAFLKTLEEPPQDTILILLTVEPQRLLETIVSRCLRVNFGSDAPRTLSSAEQEWLARFNEVAVAGQDSLLSRYRLLDVLLQKLNALKSATEETMRARSPLERYPDLDKEQRDHFEEELSAAIEAEYRRQRGELLLILQRWFRDVWMQTLPAKQGRGRQPSSDSSDELLEFPRLTGTRQVAGRLTSEQALENLQIMERTQGLLHTNVQEALALEVGLLKLHL